MNHATASDSEGSGRLHDFASVLMSLTSVNMIIILHQFERGRAVELPHEAFIYFIFWEGSENKNENLQCGK